MHIDDDADDDAYMTFIIPMHILFVANSSKRQRRQININKTHIFKWHFIERKIIIFFFPLWTFKWRSFRRVSFLVATELLWIFYAFQTEIKTRNESVE